MNGKQPGMTISPLWLQTAVLTFLAGFAVLGYLAYAIHTQHPPIPDRVRAEDGTVLFTGDDIMAGQHLFQKYGLMQFGTLFGHGAYLGPDFTAQYLHHAGLAMLDFYANQGASPAEAKARVEREIKTNAYDAGSRTLVYTTGQAHAFAQANEFHRTWFGSPAAQTGLKPPSIADPDEIRQLTAYFSWASWVAAATRPGTDYSYTNNWPPEPLAGNRPTTQAFLWSVLSLIALLGGIGVVLFLVGRYDWLGWHGREEDEPARWNSDRRNRYD